MPAPTVNVPGDRDCAQRRWLTVALTSVLVCDALVRVSFGDEISSTAYARDFLVGHAASDSWGPMTAAIERLRLAPGEPLYSHLFFLHRTKFQYPVSSIVVFDLLQRVTAASWTRLFAVVNTVSWFAVWLIGVLIWMLSDGQATNDAAKGDRRVPRRLFELAAVLTLTILFYPLTQSYMLGQIQTFVTLFAAAALLSCTRGHERVTGVLFGLCCAVKPQWAVILLWALLRRRWWLFWSAACTVAVFVAISIGMYGFVQYPDYLTVLTYIARHGETYYPNQSVNGLLNRLLLNGNPLQWQGDAFAPFNPVVYWGTVATSGALLAVVLFWRRHRRATPVDVAFVIVALTMASPVAWEHHYGVLLPVLAVLGSAVIAEHNTPVLDRLMLLIALLLSAMPLAFTARFAATRLNVLQSTLFFAAALTLASAARVLCRAR